VPPGSPIQGKVNMVFSGSMVTVGSAYAVVTSTGMNTEMGAISRGVAAAKAEEGKTPLGIKLDEFGNQLSLIIGWVCLGVWAVNAPRFAAPVFGQGLPGIAKGALHYLKVAVALGVAAIPEGLPAVITLCLSLGTRRMAARNVIVRKLPSVETLGCTTVICSDKTGTLTTNQMTAVSLVHLTPAESDDTRRALEQGAIELGDVGGGGLAAVEHAFSGLGYAPLGLVSGFSTEAEAERMGLAASAGLSDLVDCAVMCNDADLYYADGQFSRMGEPTEAALKVLAEKLGPYLKEHQGLGVVPDPASSSGAGAGAATERGAPNLEGLCSRVGDRVQAKFGGRLATLEFNRDRKSMSVLCRPAGAKPGDAVNKLFVKGAPDLLLERCAFVKLPSGEVVPMDAQARALLQGAVQNLAERPLRTIGLAIKEGEALGAELGSWQGEPSGETTPKLLTDASKFAQVESQLTFLGMTGIKDPARKEVGAAIAECHNAGIRVIMITGDSKPTAVAIARDVGIFDAETFQRENARLKGKVEESSGSIPRAYTGADFFQNLSEEEQEAALSAGGNFIFCRTEPLDKQKLVRMLQKLGETPAMTGDGVNDAPALQQAAIGIAMGIAGTEVAKEAADMVLADDNFATIVAAVEEGRCIYNNMQSFICFLISCNFGEIATVFFATLLGLPEPLSPLQLLWVNLVTDGPPATALGFNPPSPDSMKRPPRPRTEPILSSWLMIRYVLTGLYVGGATLGSMAWWYKAHGVSFHDMMRHNQVLTKRGWCLAY